MNEDLMDKIQRTRRVSTDHLHRVKRDLG